VICGLNTSYLTDSQWIGDTTPVTLCEVRVSPSNSVKPNLGALELSEALSRVLPFTAREDTRPVLQCILFKAIEGKLYLVSADGFRLSVVSLDYNDGEGEALISREELKGISSALRRAKRVRLTFNGDDVKTLILDTELIRYKWISDEGTFPEYEKLIPSEHNCLTSFDTTEAIRAVNSLKALSDTSSYPIDLTIAEGKIVMSNPDNKGSTEVSAETQGEVRVRLDGSYLAEALKACGGMIELKLTDGKSPVLFTSNGYKLVVMPMLTSESREVEPEQAEPEAETEPEPEVRGEVETETESKPKSKPKRKRKVKEPVAVA